MDKTRYMITIDAGTTNTRVSLWDCESRKNVQTLSEPIGVRNTAVDGNNSKLKAAVRDSVTELSSLLPEGYAQIKCVIASGMITSNNGLIEVPHVPAPAGIEEISEGVKEVLLEDVCPLPIYFVPGVKNFDSRIDLDNFEQMDVMRGEEVESLALIQQFHIQSPMLLILPGSHTKMVSVNEKGQITGCLTSLTGELLDSLTNHTVLADSVDRQFVEPDKYDKEMVLAGYRNAEKNGLGRATFSCRILDLFYTEDHSKLASYLLGACFQNDLNAMKNSNAIKADQNTTVIVAGKSVLQWAISDILEEDGYFSHVLKYQEEDMPLSAYGMYMVAKYKQLI